MAVDSFIKTGTGAFPGLSLDASNAIREKSKTLSSDPYEQSLIQEDMYEKALRQKDHSDFVNERTNGRMEIDKKSQESKSTEEKKQLNLQSRTGILADMLREYGHSFGKNWDNIPDDELIEKFTAKNPGQKSDFDSFINGTESRYSFAQRMGFASNNKVEDNSDNILVQAGELVVGAGAVDASINLLGRGLEKAGDVIYDLPIDSSMKEATQLQNLGANIKYAQKNVKDAKKNLKAAKKTGEGVEEAKEALNMATKELESAKGKTVTKVSDTAKEYNVGGGKLWEGWTAGSRGEQAKSEAKWLWEKTINPALENSKATINIQELINGLEDDIVKLAKNDPDKLNAYGDALDSLKDSYKASEFANYSLKDAQTLKSGLQGRTPSKVWKGKEVANELQELKAVLSGKIKNALHSKLTEEVGENSAKLYLDRANLDEYARSMAKQSTNAGFKGGFGNFTSSLYHSLTDGAMAKGGLMLDKIGKTLEKVTNPKVWVEGVSKVVKSVKKDPKVLLKGLKAIAPGDLLMPDGKELISNMKSDEKLKEWVDKNRGSEITADERKALIGEEGYSLLNENGVNSLEEKGWTPEGIIVLLDSLE